MDAARGAEALHQRDQRARRQAPIFQGREITVDAILASACLPSLYQAIEIDDPRTGRREAYWDGGYTGNPALYPLFYRTRTPDILIIHINPLHREELPCTSSEIMSRVNEISFNASLLRELRNIDFVNRLIDRGTIADGVMKRNNVHSVSDDKLMNQLGIVTKMTISRTLLLQLRDTGRAAMDRFLTEQKGNLGKRSSVNLRAMFQLGGRDGLNRSADAFGYCVDFIWLCWNAAEGRLSSLQGLDHKEVRMREREVRGQLGDVDGPASGTAVAVIVQPAGIGLVDDAVVAVVGEAGRTFPERRQRDSVPRSRAKARHHGVVEPDRILHYVEVGDPVDVVRRR